MNRAVLFGRNTVFSKYLTLLLATFFLVGCTEEKMPQHDIDEKLRLVKDLQQFGKRFGLGETYNFRSYNEALESYLICYSTDTFSLDGYYSRGNDEGCPVESGQEVFRYQAQALAGVDTPITASLMKEPLPRFAMVVFHENFHEHMEGVPSSAINESATTLIGLLMAREYIKEKKGVYSSEYSEIESDLQMFLRIARVEAYYALSFRALYLRVERGEVDRDKALIEKQEIFDRMHSECSKLVTTVVRSCKDINTNPEFSRELMYTEHYPLFNDLHVACGEDVKTTMRVIISLASKALTEERYLERIREMIRNGRTACG